MNVNSLSIAIVSYLTGAVVIYAYINRNRYIDLVLAIVAILSFATAMLLQGFGILGALTRVLSTIAEGFAAMAMVFLVVRVVGGIYATLKSYFNR
ncbi:MAG TPA: hypothetical protein VE439_10255 [Anaerolineae bacterium]|jgi:general stress protein CsbA|nr:hypothetical protein [Anaerolineae bacterium]